MNGHTTRARLYGITSHLWEKVLQALDRRCPLCLKPFSISRFPVVEHNHQTGEWRGATCSPCNQSIGWRHEDAAWFRRVADYLDDPPVKHILGHKHFVPGSPGDVGLEDRIRNG